MIHIRILLKDEHLSYPIRKKIQVEASKESSRLRGYVIAKDGEFLEGLNSSYNNLTSLIRDTQKLVQRKEDQDRLQEYFGIIVLGKEIQQGDFAVAIRKAIDLSKLD